MAGGGDGGCHRVAKELFKEKRGAMSEVKASQSASMLVEKSELDQLSQLVSSLLTDDRTSDAVVFCTNR